MADLARLGIRGLRPNLDQAASLLKALRTAEGVTIPTLAELRRHLDRLPLRQAADQGDETTRAKRVA